MYYYNLVFTINSDFYNWDKKSCYSVYNYNTILSISVSVIGLNTKIKWKILAGNLDAAEWLLNWVILRNLMISQSVNSENTGDPKSQLVILYTTVSHKRNHLCRSSVFWEIAKKKYSGQNYWFSVFNKIK